MPSASPTISVVGGAAFVRAYGCGARPPAARTRPPGTMEWAVRNPCSASVRWAPCSLRRDEPHRGAALPRGQLGLVDEVQRVVQNRGRVRRIEQLEVGGAGGGVVGERGLFGEEDRFVAPRAVRRAARQGPDHLGIGCGHAPGQRLGGGGDLGVAVRLRLPRGRDDAAEGEQPGGAAGGIGRAEPYRVLAGGGRGQLRPGVRLLGPAECRAGGGGHGQGHRCGRRVARGVSAMSSPTSCARSTHTSESGSQSS